METVIISVLVLGFYFLPAWQAMQRKHNSVGAITALNLLLGWTVVGWILALIWANTGNINTGPTPDTHVKCPDCAELIKREARICRHCGCKLIAQ